MDLTQLIVGYDLCMFYYFYVYDYVSYEYLIFLVDWAMMNLLWYVNHVVETLFIINNIQSLFRINCV